jgi:hypothetical protein
MGWIAPRTKMNDCESQSTASRSSSTQRKVASRFGLQPPMNPLLAASFLAWLSLTTGCQSWSPGSQIKQCQMESDRLLAEFRSQKKRADDLEGKYQESQSRLAEAEKLIARIQNGNGRSGGVLADRSAIPSRSSANTPNTTPNSIPNSAAGLPSRSTGNSDPNIQWRPQGAPLR